VLCSSQAITAHMCASSETQERNDCESTRPVLCWQSMKLLLKESIETVLQKEKAIALRTSVKSIAPISISKFIEVICAQCVIHCTNGPRDAFSIHLRTTRHHKYRKPKMVAHTLQLENSRFIPRPPSQSHRKWPG